MSKSKYEYPDAGVLINIPGMRDACKLSRFERTAALERLARLELKPMSGLFDLHHLQEIHRHIFERIYPFAGELREEDIAKDYFIFAPTQYIRSSAQSLFQQLQQEDYLRNLPADKFADRAAYYMGEMNVLHPFREGNGRTLRVFMRQLARHAGFDLDWTKVSVERIFRASVRSKSDTADLTAVIMESIGPL